jgi:Tol biopolymer transport system component
MRRTQGHSARGFLQKLALSSAALLLVLVMITAHNKSVSYGATNGLIVFTRSDGSNDQLFDMNPDGSNVQQLTTDSSNHESPVWSPDGTKIAYVDDSNSSQQIYVMNANGSNAVDVSNNADNDYTPQWSPDGTKIMYSQNYQDIAVMNANGSNQQTIVSDTDSVYYPSWSPDGTKIVYSCDQASSVQLCTAHADGSDETQITSGAGYNEYPSWSPTNNEIVFVYEPTAYDDKLAVINPDGSGLHTLPTGEDNSYSPTWSPDGTKIVYSNQNSGDTTTRIYSINTDGSGETALSPNDGSYASTPSWQAIQSSNDVSITNPVSGQTNVVQSSCSSVSGVSAVAAPAGYPDNGYTYPDGILSYTTNCGTNGATATITLYYYGLSSTPVYTLRKYSSVAHTYQTIPGATVTSTTLGGAPVIKATYQITDGGLYDEDGTANGVIIDPVGLAETVSVTTLTDTGTNIMITTGLSAFTICMAFFVRRMKYATEQL